MIPQYVHKQIDSIYKYEQYSYNPNIIRGCVETSPEKLFPDRILSNGLSIIFQLQISDSVIINIGIKLNIYIGL